MKILKSLVLLVLFMAMPAKADDAFSWMSTSFGGLKSLFGCLEVPEFTSFQEGNIGISISTAGIWQSTGNTVEKGKLLKINWSTSGVTSKPRKYLVLYRIDPRFSTPQVFIKTYNYSKLQFEALGFPRFVTDNNSETLGAIPPDKDLDALSFTKMSDAVKYFNYSNGNSRIEVKAGDVVNISLIDKDNFFSSNTLDNILTQELDSSIFAASALYTQSNLGNFDNRIIYSSAEQVCNMIDKERKSVCSGTGTATKYKNTDNGVIVGKPMTMRAVQYFMDLINTCPANAGINTSPACYYDQGRGMIIKVGGQVIKGRDQSFVNSGSVQNSFIYYQATSGGTMDFTSDWQVSNMFSNSVLMSDWSRNFSNYASFVDYINKNDWSANFLYFGRYSMVVEIGNGTNSIDPGDQQNIKLEYLITSDGTLPDPSVRGTPVDYNFAADVPQDGYLWLRVVNPNSNIQGVVSVNYANYTGTTWFSDIIYNGAIKPITDQFRTFSQNFYIKLVKNSAVQNLAKAALTLYVTIFGLMFVAGALKLTAVEVITRICKIAIVAFLIREESWSFFNTYFFSAFTDGIDFFVTNVVGATSSRSNIFGFIDPIFDKYTNGRIWGLLFIELLQIHNGLAFIAIITIYSLITYFRAILEVIIGYVIAFIGVTVMISLAPFFIILMLFEKTKSLFDNWISTLLSYVVQPTILLIFFLLIDQVLSEQLLKVVVRACWDTLIPIKIGLDLTNLGIPIHFSFTLPFLPGIPFYVPDVPEISSSNILTNNANTFLVLFTTALLFYSYCLMSYGLVTFVNIVVGMLTNVTPARISGNYQERSDPVGAVMQDIDSVTKPVKKAAMAPARVFKNKIIDQNYKARKSERGGEFTNKFLAERNDVKKEAGEKKE
ncbi:type IV secretion system protein [Rickettsia montanensis]|uniref:Channel protein n=1 Tax=Rickettsia montanensis (strain OSU 85-930) TaxID=1105114 RepID=H8KBU3_RICMS|nr:type IV secretion system protein [Rickettsia montanensis]AFC73809.1 channel protein [Rickettsia montanensis str. OSU 85-930]